MKKRFYYVNARHEGKTILLCGPFFNDIGTPEKYIDACVELLHETGDPIAPYASYGIVGLNANIGLGIFNKQLRAAGHLDVPVDTTN